MKNLLLVFALIYLLLASTVSLYFIYDAQQTISFLEEKVEELHNRNEHYRIMWREIYSEMCRRTEAWAEISKDPELVKKAKRSFQKREKK